MGGMAKAVAAGMCVWNVCVWNEYVGGVNGWHGQGSSCWNAETAD